MKVEEFLRKEKIPYTKIHHPEVYTAQEVAATAHVPGREMAKVVVVKAADEFALAVCPADRQIDMKKLSKLADRKVRLANEGEMEDLFPDAELGAEAPFGSLYGMKTYVDSSLAENDEIAFEAGTHTDVVRIAYKDFEKAAEPEKGSFTTHV